MFAQEKMVYKACKNNTGAKGRGSDLFFATQSDPIRTRDGLGAVLKEECPSYRCLTATRGHPYLVASFSERSGVVSGNSSSEGLSSAGSEHPSHNAYPQQKNTAKIQPFLLLSRRNHFARLAKGDMLRIGVSLQVL